MQVLCFPARPGDFRSPFAYIRVQTCNHRTGSIKTFSKVLHIITSTIIPCSLGANVADFALRVDLNTCHHVFALRLFRRQSADGVHVFQDSYSCYSFTRATRSFQKTMAIVFEYQLCLSTKLVRSISQYACLPLGLFLVIFARYKQQFFPTGFIFFNTLSHFMRFLSPLHTTALVTKAS